MPLLSSKMGTRSYTLVVERGTIRERVLETIDDGAWIAHACDDLGTRKELIEQPHVCAPTTTGVKDDIGKAFVIPGENLPENADALRVRN